MIRRRDNLWVAVHDMSLTMPNRRVLAPNSGIDTSITVTYTNPTEHNEVVLGSISELTPYPGYITGTGRVQTAHSGAGGIAELIADDPYRHRARAQWSIDFIDGQPALRIRAIHITRSPHRISHQEVGVTPASQKPNPCLYTRSSTDTSPVATGTAPRPSPSPRQ